MHGPSLSNDLAVVPTVISTIIYALGTPSKTNIHTCTYATSGPPGAQCGDAEKASHTYIPYQFKAANSQTIIPTPDQLLISLTVQQNVADRLHTLCLYRFSGVRNTLHVYVYIFHLFTYPLPVRSRWAVH